VGARVKAAPPRTACSAAVGARTDGQGRGAPQPGRAAGSCPSAPGAAAKRGLEGVGLRPQSPPRLRASPGGDARPGEVPSCRTAPSEAMAGAWLRGFAGKRGATASKIAPFANSWCQRRRHLLRVFVTSPGDHASEQQRSVNCISKA